MNASNLPKDLSQSEVLTPTIEVRDVGLKAFVTEVKRNRISTMRNSILPKKIKPLHSMVSMKSLKPAKIY